MNVLLINPTFYDEDQFRNRFQDYVEWIRSGNLYVAPFEPPLGLAYLTAYLKQRGHDVTLLDMQGLMMDSAALVRHLAAAAPPVIGITVMTPTLPAAHIVLGGVHPTLDPEGVLADPSVDFVVRGEGEEALAQLLDALQGHRPLESVEGLCYRLDGANHISPKSPLIADLASLPAPDYQAFPIERYV
jgi:radical SAM superfamily enzyme YgiQ (UPF0313 family)